MSVYAVSAAASAGAGFSEIRLVHGSQESGSGCRIETVQALVGHSLISAVVDPLDRGPLDLAGLAGDRFALLAGVIFRHRLGPE